VQSEMLNTWTESMVNADAWGSGAQQIERSDEHGTIIREVEESRTPMCSESIRWSALDAEHGIIWR
jgi:hypothetical protein